MAFKRYRGLTVTRWLPVTVSTTFTAGDIVAWSSGYLIKATTTSAAKTHVGVIKKTIAATDSDYATARLVPVEIPNDKMVEWRVTGTTFVVTENGLWGDLATAGTVVNPGTGSTYDAYQQKSIISTTEAIVVLNLGGAVETIN